MTTSTNKTSIKFSTVIFSIILVLSFIVLGYSGFEFFTTGSVSHFVPGCILNIGLFGYLLNRSINNK